MNNLTEIGKKAKAASLQAARLSPEEIDSALKLIAGQLIQNTDAILKENQKDISKAKENGIRDVMIDRLLLTEERIAGIAEGIIQVSSLKSPIGGIRESQKLENGLLVGKMRVPMGVVAMIYESRPNVTADAASLTLKTGNAVILRGGKEAIHSNIAIAGVMRQTLASCGLNPDIIQMIEDTSRETATALMKLNGYVDVLIPRGGAGLIQSVVENATVNVIETGVGNCHIYVDQGCDLDMAKKIVFNAKTQRPSVCNAAESLLVHRQAAKAFLPLVKAALEEKNVEIRGCEKTREIISCVLATEEDYFKEYLDYIISVKVVDSFDQAVEHINRYSTHHSEAIITNDYQNAQRFLNEVDSAAVDVYKRQSCLYSFLMFLPP